MIDLRYVKKLIEMLDGSSVDSIEISSDKGMKLRISKTPQQRGAVQVAAPVPVPALLAPAAAPTAAAVVAAQAVVDSAAAAARPEPVKGLEIKSPMVGTFYAAAEPGAKPYVSVGQRISKGEVVCIIEAMKIMNEIESEYDGEVTEVLAANGHAVEYGQVLFRVDPSA